MNNKWIGIIIGILALGVIGLVVWDTSSNRIGKRGANPYELEVDQYYEVDPELILYKEVKQVKLGERVSQALAYHDQKLYVLTNSEVLVLDLTGSLIHSFTVEQSGKAIHANEQAIFVGQEQSILQYYPDGRLIKAWDSFGENTIITSIGSFEDEVFVADAGNRRVLRCDSHGNVVSQFEGKRNVDDLHGFVVPSANFDLAFYLDELWVVNPGSHSIENYSFEGLLRGFWEKSTMKIDGFSGCCNPAQICIDAEGNFITSEKGLVRMKIYKASGELIGVVAAPDQFEQSEKAPEPVVTETGTIIALDFESNQIRFFDKK